MTVDDLEQIDAIRRLKARYFRCLDTKDWDGWIGVFAPDATMLVDTEPSTMGRDGKPGARIEGQRAILDHVRPIIDRAVTVHHGHMPEIELTGPDEARGIWAMEDVVEFDTQILRGYGHYHERYRRIDGAWKIAALHLTRLRVDFTPV